MRSTLATIMALISVNTFAMSTIECKSDSFKIKVNDIEESAIANYSVNGEENYAADIDLEKSYISDRVIAMGLKVDGQSKKIEISASKNSTGIFTGRLFFGNLSQVVVCKKI